MVVHKKQLNENDNNASKKANLADEKMPIDGSITPTENETELTPEEIKKKIGNEQFGFNEIEEELLSNVRIYPGFTAVLSERDGLLYSI